MVKGKTNLVCKLVATEFVTNPNNYNVVLHINGDVNDNKACNLKWDCGIKEEKEGVIWKVIKDFENYEASTMGHIRNKLSGKLVKPRKRFRPLCENE